MFFRLTFYFSTGFFVYIALGFNQLNLLYILAIQALMHMTISFIPTPGNLGACEYAFYLFYFNIYPAKTLMVALLLWRTMTYYYKLFFTGMVAFISHLRLNEKVEE